MSTAARHPNPAECGLSENIAAADKSRYHADILAFCGIVCPLFLNIEKALRTFHKSLRDDMKFIVVSSTVLQSGKAFLHTYNRTILRFASFDKVMCFWLRHINFNFVYCLQHAEKLHELQIAIHAVFNYCNLQFHYELSILKNLRTE